MQPLFVLTHGISSRKKEQEKGRLACWSIPCAMFCPNTACYTSHGQGQGLYWKQSCCSDTGAKQLSTLQNRASPFQSNIKCVFYHCKHPGVILHASDPSSYLQTSALCWQTHSCKALQWQERQWCHSTGPKPSVSEVYEWVATGHVESHSDFLYVRPLYIFWKWTSPESIKKKRTMLSLFSFTVGMKDILVFIKCFD